MSTRRSFRLLLVAVAVLLAANLAPAIADVLGPPAPDPLPKVAFVARNDNPADALAVGPVAGALGGVLATTPSTRLSDEAAATLTSFAPEVVYVAGGTAAITGDTYEAIDSAGPWETRRLPGVNRDDTARLIATVLEDLGVGRPLVTGGQVVGDAWLGGTLTDDGPAPTTATTWAAKDAIGGDAVTTSGGLETLHELEVDVPTDGVLTILGSAHVANPSASDAYEITLVTTLDYAREPGTLFDNIVGYANEYLYPDTEGSHRTAAVASGAVAVEAGIHTVTLEILGGPETTYDLSQLVVTFAPGGSAPGKGIAEA